jgi:hypothetical protein
MMNEGGKKWVALREICTLNRNFKDSDFLPYREKKILRPAAAKKAEDKVSDIHKLSKSSDHHRQR